jgi:hypothetical protein
MRGKDVPTPLDQRRLRDGRLALDASQELSAMTIVQLRELRDTLFDGALALQSLDDLGSPEANRAAWNDCVELDRRIVQVDDEIARRTATSSPREVP